MEKIIGGKWQRRRRNLRQLANGERFECTHFVRKYTYARTGRCLSRLIWPSHKDTLTSKTKSSILEPLKSTMLTKKWSTKLALNYQQKGSRGHSGSFKTYSRPLEVLNSTNKKLVENFNLVSTVFWTGSRRDTVHNGDFFLKGNQPN